MFKAKMHFLKDAYFSGSAGVRNSAVEDTDIDTINSPHSDEDESSNTTEMAPTSSRHQYLSPKATDQHTKSKLTNGKKHITTTPTTDREARTSFASFKEERNAVAQSFRDSKTSSYARPAFQHDSETAIDDSASERSFGLDGVSATGGMTAVTNPSSMLHGAACECEGFRGWKQISVGGKMASRSFGDLRRFLPARKGGRWEPNLDLEEERGMEGVVMMQNGSKRGRKNGPGESALEMLPMELLDQILSNLTIPPSSLHPLLLTSRTLAHATLPHLYSSLPVPHSPHFRRLLTTLTAHPSLGSLVQTLDFSHFNPIGNDTTARSRALTMNLTSSTLLQCLSLLPNLREFLAQEHIDSDLSAHVLRKLFTTPSLRALDLCACSSSSFRDAMMGVFCSPSALALPAKFSITRLSLHECTVLPASVITAVLRRLPAGVTHLDLSHTRVTDEGLEAFLTSAPGHVNVNGVGREVRRDAASKLTHLNLSRCASLSGSAVVSFLRQHGSNLIYLNLGMDAKSAEMLDEIDIRRLVPTLPKSLRSLSLRGSKMDSNCITLLQDQVAHLEELGIGRGVGYSEVARLVLPDQRDDDDDDEEEEDNDDNESVDDETMDIDPSAEQKKETNHHTLRYIDMSDLPILDLSQLFHPKTSILSPSSLPLEVIEVSASEYQRLRERDVVLRNLGWVCKEAGRRGWLVRDPTASTKAIRDAIRKGSRDAKGVKDMAMRGNKHGHDDGSRSWKMGATYWGMRKVPVAKAEVGGMYGLYMFKR